MTKEFRSSRTDVSESLANKLLDELLLLEQQSLVGDLSISEKKKVSEIKLDK